MARGNRPGIFRRIVNAVERALGIEPEPARRPEPPPEPPRRPGGPDWFPPPPVEPSEPRYNPDRDTWSGTGAPTARQWEGIKTLAYDAIENGACWNKNLDLNDNAEFSTGEVATDLAAIIEALSSGLISVDDITSMLKETRRAANEYALQQDGRRGRARWTSRNQDLPDELFWYHWGF